MGESRRDPKRVTVMIEGLENVLYDFLKSTDTKTIVEELVIFIKEQNHTLDK